MNGMTRRSLGLRCARADLAILAVRCVGNPACYRKTYHVRDLSLPWPPPGVAAR